MDSIDIGWNRQTSTEVHFLPHRQYFQQQTSFTLEDQENKPKKKKVHFNIRTPTAKQQAFENTEYNRSKQDRSQTLIFDDHDYPSSSTNSFTAE